MAGPKLLGQGSMDTILCIFPISNLQNRWNNASTAPDYRGVCEGTTENGWSGTVQHGTQSRRGRK